MRVATPRPQHSPHCSSCQTTDCGEWETMPGSTPPLLHHLLEAERMAPQGWPYSRLQRRVARGFCILVGFVVSIKKKLPVVTRYGTGPGTGYSVPGYPVPGTQTVPYIRVPVSCVAGCRFVYFAR